MYRKEWTQIDLPQIDPQQTDENQTVLETKSTYFLSRWLENNFFGIDIREIITKQAWQADWSQEDKVDR